jgi:hypothetical protein
MPDENEQDATGKQSGSSTGSGADWKSEEAYWREQHGTQPYADKNRSYQDYAAAYRVAVEGAGKYAGRDYDEVEQSLATDYERAEPGSGLPWDTVRPAAKAAWDRLSGVIGPRDSDRGIRGSI